MISGGQPFDGRNLLLSYSSDPRNAGALRFSVDQDGACPTLSFSAAIFASGQIQLFPQHTEQAGLRLGVDRIRPSIDRQLNRSHAKLQSEETAIEEILRTALQE
jgi:hypothetical protein